MVTRGPGLANLQLDSGCHSPTRNQEKHPGHPKEADFPALEITPGGLVSKP